MQFKTLPRHVFRFARCLSAALLSAALLAALCVLPGCGDGGDSEEPAGILLGGQAVQTGLLARPLDREIQITVHGSDENGPAKNVPAPGVRVAFRIVSAPVDADGTAFTRAEAVTNAAGLASSPFVVGDKPGIYRIKAGLPDYPAISPVVVTVIGGVRILGTGQDGSVGKPLDKPLAVQFEKAPGERVAAGDGLVRFTLMSAPSGTALSGSLRRSDENGDASTEIRLGGTQGRVDVGISILDGIPGNTSLLPPITIGFFSIDVVSVAVTLLGGLALFLYGMRMMSESLHFVAGDKLRDILNLLTKNRFVAVAAGAGVTAIIQSSSACTVMVVGFVNAGLMRLEQAIGVIMGANIGTTITAQIISLKLSALALPAVFVGVLILLVAKSKTAKHWAGIVIGFGILFLGMNIMSSELGQLRDSETVVSLFKGLECAPGADGFIPFFGFLKAVGCGLAVTLVLQSSSATVGLLIAVASTGLIDPYAAFGILLGDNIGTTITAVLASIGTGTAARRAAIFHVTFNVTGCVIMICLNYVNWPGRPGRPVFMELANILTPGDVFIGGENLPRFIANAHTLFNITCTGLFIGFLPQFAAWCRWVVKAGSEDGVDTAAAPRILEPHLLSTPSLALQQVWTEVGIMLEKAREAQNEGYRALVSDASEWNSAARVAKDLEKETDDIKAAITRYMSGISLTTLNENQSEMFPHLIRTVNDAERVADLGKHLSKLAKRVNKRSLKLTAEAVSDMTRMNGLVNELLELAERSVNSNADGIELSGGGAVLRGRLLDDGLRLDRDARAMATELRKNHERRHEEGLCDVKAGVVFMDVAGSLARAAGLALNIVQAACHTPERVTAGSLRLAARKPKAAKE